LGANGVSHAIARLSLLVYTRSSLVSVSGASSDYKGCNDSTDARFTATALLGSFTTIYKNNRARLMLPPQSSKSPLRSQDMLPSCSASSAVVSVRHPVLKTPRLSSRSIGRGGRSTEEEDMQLYHSIERSVRRRTWLTKSRHSLLLRRLHSGRRKLVQLHPRQHRCAHRPQLRCA
jgi:hypothetical protein